MRYSFRFCLHRLTLYAHQKFVSYFCYLFHFNFFYILMISKLVDVMILNKSLLLYINHFDSIKEHISNIKSVFI